MVVSKPVCTISLDQVDEHTTSEYICTRFKSEETNDGRATDGRSKHGIFCIKQFYLLGVEQREWRDWKYKLAMPQTLGALAPIFCLEFCDEFRVSDCLEDDDESAHRPRLVC